MYQERLIAAFLACCPASLHLRQVFRLVECQCCCREEKERAAAAAADAAEAQSAPAAEGKEAAEKAAKKLEGNAR